MTEIISAPVNRWSALQHDTRYEPRQYWLSDGVNVWLGQSDHGDLRAVTAAKYVMPAFCPDPPTVDEIAAMKKPEA